MRRYTKSWANIKQRINIRIMDFSDEGVFKIDLKDAKAVLEFSFIGMKKKRVNVSATQNSYIKVTLEEESQHLGETVVTGYRNVNKNSYTGSSTQILGDDLRKVSQTNIRFRP